MRLRIVSVLILAVAVVWQAPVMAQAAAQPSCPLPAVNLTLNQAVPAPAGFDQVAFFDTKSGSPLTSPTDLAGTPPSFKINDIVLNQAQAFKDPKTHTDNQIQLRWGQKADPTKGCLQPYNVVQSQPAPPAAANPAVTPPAAATAETPVDVQDCQRQGRQLRDTIRNQRAVQQGSPADDFSLIVFCRDLTAFPIGRDYGVEGEPIYVALYDDGTLSNPHAEIPTCSIEQAGPRTFQSETSLPKVSGLQSGQPFGIKELLVRSCFDASVQIDLRAQRTDIATQKLVDVTKSFVLGQDVRYHATLQLGALFTNQQPHTFGLRTDDQNMKHIFDKGPDGQGPEYVATLVLYSLPRQLESLFGGPAYHGRDILHEQKFADRLGGVLGVGLNDPGKLFVAGFSFELLSYVNLTAVYSWARLPELAGVKEGDVFTGTADQIPTHDVWKGRFALGISIDLRYATTLFRR